MRGSLVILSVLYAYVRFHWLVHYCWFIKIEISDWLNWNKKSILIKSKTVTNIKENTFGKNRNMNPAVLKFKYWICSFTGLCLLKYQCNSQVSTVISSLVFCSTFKLYNYVQVNKTIKNLICPY